MERIKWIFILSFCTLAISLLSFLLFFYIKDFYSNSPLDNVKVISYSNKDHIFEMSKLIDVEKCGYKSDSDIKWVNASDNKCMFLIDSNLREVYIKKGIFTRKFMVSDLLLGDIVSKKIFLAVGEEKKITLDINITSDKKKFVYEAVDKNILSISDDKVVGNKKGVTKIKVTINNKYIRYIDVEVTDLIVKRPSKFNKNKKNLVCKQYSKEEASKLDEILSNRIEGVGGYGTRAAVVESIRFLLLDFPYQIEYFFENGRLSGGVHKVDGEGRYYHRGLYLSTDKYKDIDPSYVGPSMWGCPLKNFEDWGSTFKKGMYKPNGLDCSGFVSWAIYNGGYDVGDRGAGDNEKDNSELNDIGGKKVKITDEFVKSGKLKAGDIVGIWGHIAIVAGIDKDNVYVAESLWTFGGPVINTYKKNKLDDKFVQAVLLDEVYKKDGLYTEMW